LRGHLFEQIEELRDPDKKIDLDRVKAVNAVARTIIDSAKVENQFYEITGTEPANEFFKKGQRQLGNGANGK